MNGISVVIVMLAGKEYLGRCLEALMAQLDVEISEIIVPFDSTAVDVSQLLMDFPSVRFEALPGKQSFAELRSSGFRLADGNIIALTEDHCIPDPHWCKRILDLHESDRAVAVGGAVEKEGKDSALNWAVYLCDFSRYMNPLPDGEVNYLTDCNVSYKRVALQTLRQIWEKEFHETTVHWALLDRGEKLRISPEVIVHQQRSLSFSFALRERYKFARLFAGTRAAYLSNVARSLFAAGSVLLPALLSFRVAANVFRKRKHRARFAGSLLHILLLNFVWAAGEFVGYLTGRPEKVLAPASGRSETVR